MQRPGSFAEEFRFPSVGSRELWKVLEEERNLMLMLTKLRWTRQTIAGKSGVSVRALEENRKPLV